MQAIILDRKLKSLVASERKITHEILLLIQTLDITKSFRELGYSSLYEYLVKEIGYSEGSAQRRISSARLMKQVPQIANDLKCGNLNLTQVSLAQVAIRQEEKARSQNPTANPLQSGSSNRLHSTNISLEQKFDILKKLKSKTTFETQKILKDNLPAFEIPKPKVIPVGNDKVQVTLQFSESDWEKVQALMAHFSHTIPDQKIESLLLYWQAQVKKKKQKQLEKIQSEKIVVPCPQSVTSDEKMKSSDILPPLRRRKKNDPNLEGHNRSFDANPKNRRSYIPAKIKIQVRSHAEDRCEFISDATGKRCESKHFLETEHRIPVAYGGTNTVQNLRFFCRSHNALAAKAWGISI